MTQLLSTQQLALLAGVDPVVIRSLEEGGILKPAPGKAGWRRRWSKAHVGDLIRALRLYPHHNRPAEAKPFNAVLAPGALAQAAHANPEEDVVTTPKSESVPEIPPFPQAEWDARTKHKLLGTKTAKAIWESWHTLRPGSRNEASATKKVAEAVSKVLPKPLAAINVRSYLVALGLVQKLTGGYFKRNPSAIPRDYVPVKAKAPTGGAAHRNRSQAPRVNGTTPAPEALPSVTLLTRLPVAELKGAVELAEQIEAANLTTGQRAFLIAWLQQGGA